MKRAEEERRRRGNMVPLYYFSFKYLINPGHNRRK